MNLRKHYIEKFACYPDLVDLPTFRMMMGGIGDSFARRLIRENRVQSFFVKPNYWIVKASVIDYILSDDYAARKVKVRA